MNKRKLLIENFIIYGLGTVLCNLIPFIMIPILVRIMPDSAYYMGINDLVNSVISLAAVVGLIGMYDALFRLFFDYKENDLVHKKEICSTALGLTVFFSSVCMVILIILRKQFSNLFFGTESLSYLIYICAVSVLVLNVKNIVMTPTRMLNQRIIYVIGNTLLPMASYGIAFLMVLSGLYILALPIGALLSSALGVIYFGIVNRKWFSIKHFNYKKVIPLLRIGVPLFPTFLVFWIYSSCDKVMILQMKGANANGMYAVANKLAAISQLVTTAFTSGWSYYNFATMKDEDRVKDFSKIVEYLFAIGIFIFGLCRIFGNEIMCILFTEQYENTGNTFAYLFLAPIVFMVYQLLGSQFLLIKKTIYETFIACVGVVLNILLNYIWIKEYDIVGAGVATVVSYLFIVLLAGTILYKKKMIYINKREYVLVIFLGIFVGLEFTKSNIVLRIVFWILMEFIILILYKDDIKSELLRLRKR